MVIGICQYSELCTYDLCNSRYINPTSFKKKTSIEIPFLNCPVAENAKVLQHSLLGSWEKTRQNTVTLQKCVHLASLLGVLSQRYTGKNM